MQAYVHNIHHSIHRERGASTPSPLLGRCMRRESRNTACDSVCVNNQWFVVFVLGSTYTTSNALSIHLQIASWGRLRGKVESRRLQELSRKSDKITGTQVLPHSTNRFLAMMPITSDLLRDLSPDAQDESQQARPAAAPGAGRAEPVEQSESPAHRAPEFSLKDCVCTEVPIEADFVIIESRRASVSSQGRLLALPRH